MGNFAYIVNSRAPVDFTIAIGQHVKGLTLLICYMQKG